MTLKMGYVTTHESIAGKSVRALERALGFSFGTLNRGYLVYELKDTVAVGEFQWKDLTRYSDGWNYDPFIHAFVQRDDENRFQLWKAANWDEALADTQLQEFMKAQCRALKVCTGPRRIVKLVPKSDRGTFPDSRVPNIPQWKLTTLKYFEFASLC